VGLEEALEFALVLECCQHLELTWLDEVGEKAYRPLVDLMRRQHGEVVSHQPHFACSALNVKDDAMRVDACGQRKCRLLIAECQAGEAEDDSLRVA
jgi:hypothetical protein